MAEEKPQVIKDLQELLRFSPEDILTRFKPNRADDPTCKDFDLEDLGDAQLHRGLLGEMQSLMVLLTPACMAAGKCPLAVMLCQQAIERIKMYDAMAGLHETRSEIVSAEKFVRRVQENLQVIV